MKTEDIKKMAQAWLQVQEASYGKKKMEASDTQMGTITVKTDAEREARAKAYRDKKKAETNEAMDPVNPKELKGKHKDRKDKDINNDGKVDSTDKYLHARRKAVSAAIKGKKKDQEVEVQTSEAKIDEISKDKLGNYLTKVPASSADAGKAGDTKKFVNRRIGTKDAVRKLTGKARVPATEAVEELGENKALLKHYKDLKSQGKKDHHAIDYLMSMPKFKNMTRDKMAKTIGDAKRKGIFKEAADHGNMNNGSPAGEGLSPSAKKELARKTPMPDFVNEPKIDKKTFDTMRASGKKAKARNGDNQAGDKNVINKPMDITAKAPKKEDDGFKDS